MNCESLFRPRPTPTQFLPQNHFQIIWWVRKKHLSLEFFKIGSVGNMVWTRSCQDRVRFLIPSWTATWKLMKTDLTAGFGERFWTASDCYCFAVYRKRLHFVINALKFRSIFWDRKILTIVQMWVHFTDGFGPKLWAILITNISYFST